MQVMTKHTNISLVLPRMYMGDMRGRTKDILVCLVITCMYIAPQEMFILCEGVFWHSVMHCNITHRAVTIIL